MQQTMLLTSTSTNVANVGHGIELKNELSLINQRLKPASPLKSFTKKLLSSSKPSPVFTTFAIFKSKIKAPAKVVKKPRSSIWIHKVQRAILREVGSVGYCILIDWERS